MPSESPAFALNSKCINLKEEHWLENTSPGDFLIQEGLATPETMSESNQNQPLLLQLLIKFIFLNRWPDKNYWYKNIH